MRIKFILIPEHMCVDGSERADMLEGSATISGGQPMDRTDILNALIECGHKKNFHN
uniref:Uncharacterized protein n=1 Tax=Arion vulgaris TaxID=1028688 RepID=A0A0B7A7Y0_9EUPU